MKKANDLENEKVPSLFIRLVIPAMIAQLVTLAYNVVDRIYIGHIPETGNIALTGVGVCMPITIILSAFAQLIGLGGAPRASFFLGKHELLFFLHWSERYFCCFLSYISCRIFCQIR